MWLTPKKGSPYLYARWNHPDGSGRVLSRSTGETTERAAAAKGREYEAEFSAEWQRSQAGGNIGSQQVIEEYWQTELKKKKWAASAEVHLERIATFLGNRPYCDVTIADAARLVDQMEADPKISDATINRMLAVWRRMHNVASDIRLYPVQKIAWKSLMRDEPEGRKRNLSADEIRRLMRVLPQHLREIVAFAILTGARRNQIVTLTWDRVDLERGTATVFKKHRKKFVPHVVQLNKQAIDLLRRRADAMLTDGSVGAEARCFDTTNFQHGFEKAVRDAGLKDFRFHDLRHTHGTALARKSGALVTMHQLGHADLRTSLRYIHTAEQDVKDAVDQFPAIPIDDEQA